jgi:D-alanyl-lipoteichoic acid acyltransferase DltB (MBOAT superfamily)
MRAAGHLDSWRGVFGWHSLFNLVVLRMISFNCDYHWAVQAAGSAAASLTPHSTPISLTTHRASCLDCAHREQSPCAAWRAQTAARFSDYNALTYYAYLFYPPLHFAGPTMTFNHFVSNIRSPHQLPVPYLLQYAARLLLAGAVLELLLHYLYVFALAQPALLPRLNVVSVLALVYWTLNSIWLKFLIIWRFMRWWALLDGLEPVENMLRCVDNNHSVQEFWRDWHRAFNRWLIRYIYVPMGGNLAHSASSPAVLLLRRVLNVFIVFTWVAYWHDRTLQLLAWGWLISLVFVPELLASHLVRRTSLPSSPHYRHIKSAGGAVNILLMMLCNLVGYSVGIGGTLEVLRRALQAGLTVWLLMFAAFFAAVQIQLEVRRREQWQRERLKAQLGVMGSDGRGKALD